MKRASSKLIHSHFHNNHLKKSSSSISIFSKDFHHFSSLPSTNQQNNKHPSNAHLKSCIKIQPLLFSSHFHETPSKAHLKLGLKIQSLLFTRHFSQFLETPSKFHVKSCIKMKTLLFSRKLSHFLETPCHKFTTLVDPQKPSSRQRKTKERSEIFDEFEAAKSSEEMVKAFEKMQTVFDENELGLACLKIGLKLDEEGEYPEKVIEYANRALKIFDENDNDNDDNDNDMSLPLAMNLQLLGSACYSLNKFNESLGYLNRANRILGKLEETMDSNDGFEIKHVLHAVHLNLANTKNAMGRREDAIGNLKKCLEIKEMTLEGNSRELGNAYRDMAEAYVALLSFSEALPYCEKAMEIHKVHLGSNSVEVAHNRRLLGVIYTGLEEHQKALEENQLSQRVLKNWGLNSDLLRAEIDAANMQIALGKFDEAINTLKSVVLQTDKESEDRALIFVSMAKALCNQEKFPEGKRCLQMACGILDKKEKSSPLAVAEAYMEISMQYETMNEFETAISLLKKAQSMLEKIPQEQHSVGSASARIGWLLLLTGKVQESIPYLEDATERLKENFGSKHFGVGYVYNNLGAAYLELDRPQSAAQVFALAKDIMDTSLGPHHVDSIEACQNLSKAYSAMGSYGLAINFQEKAIDAWRGHGPSANDELREAQRVLVELKVKASCEPKDKKTLPEHHGRKRSSKSIT
uniref:protein KINESIN LIGHT CHAIN-RELATED 1 n=1 Tax=Erigeron canadensis TaxID=72917 RepID=UPI001CB8AFB9|nr:protein KINESIN LIGHT CHAIN-RELATED 1 [Erigeron canadensis]